MFLIPLLCGAFWPWDTSLLRLAASAAALLLPASGLWEGLHWAVWLPASGLWTGRVGGCSGLPWYLSPAAAQGSLQVSQQSQVEAQSALGPLWGSHRASLRLWPHPRPPGGRTVQAPVQSGVQGGDAVVPSGSRSRSQPCVVLQASWARILPPALSPRQRVCFCFPGRQSWADLPREEPSCR